MSKLKKQANVSKYCVACGSCISQCPLNAINIIYGVKAEIKKEKCVGCGKCSKICPASAIDIITIEV